MELARKINPEQVVELEEEWGDSLVENKQADAAISHYIEAGCTKKALEAAVNAKQWKKAMHIIQVIDDSQSVDKYYKIIGQHFASIQVRKEQAGKILKTNSVFLRTIKPLKKCTLLAECTEKQW